MQIPCTFVIVPSILIINFKLCYSKVYLKPADAFGSDLQNSLISKQNNDLIIVFPNNLDGNNEYISNEIKQTNQLAVRDKLQEADKSNIDAQDTDKSDLEIDDLNLNSVQKGILRKRWNSKCDKRAAKTCRSACKNAYKIVCGTYKCRSKMKREFRRECKRNCKSKFVSSVSSLETD